MTSLDASALHTDPHGMALLRVLLGSPGRCKCPARPPASAKAIRRAPDVIGAAPIESSRAVAAQANAPAC